LHEGIADSYVGVSGRVIAGHSGMRVASLGKRAFFGSLKSQPLLFQQSKTITANLHKYFGPDFP
jgi:hypothetical protein